MFQLQWTEQKKELNCSEGSHLSLDSWTSLQNQDSCPGMSERKISQFTKIIIFLGKV